MMMVAYIYIKTHWTINRYECGWYDGDADDGNPSFDYIDESTSSVESTMEPGSWCIDCSHSSSDRWTVSGDGDWKDDVPSSSW
jgi:hypothetical protein